MYDDLTERIERIEKECNQLKLMNKRWQICTLIFTLIALLEFSVGFSAQSSPKIVEAEVFRLRDSNSKIRAQNLHVGKDAVEMAFMDDKGRARLAIGVNKAGIPRIDVLDLKDLSRISCL